MNEADRLLRSIMEYASVKREEGVKDFMDIMESYAKEFLPGHTSFSGSAIRYSNVIREYLKKDPVVQRKLVGFE